MKAIIAGKRNFGGNKYFGDIQMDVFLMPAVPFSMVYYHIYAIFELTILESCDQQIENYCLER